jgi:hypothetical protein
LDNESRPVPVASLRIIAQTTIIQDVPDFKQSQVGILWLLKRVDHIVEKNPRRADDIAAFTVLGWSETLVGRREP